jgi:arylsulfatase A-like enzyme
MKHDVKRRFEHLFGVSRMSDRDLEAISGMYDAALWGLDHATGQLLHELESRELLDETVVVLVSDHGEMLGEHGLLGHEYALYQELVHVPLIVRYPQVFPAGRRVEAPVQLNDLYGSLLQLAGVTPPTDLPAAGREHSYGLVDAVEGGHTDRPLLAEYLEPKEERLRVVMRRSPEADIDPTPWLQPLRSWLRGDWKLVWAGDSPRGLFELSADAAESTDLSFEHEERVGRMRDAMRRMVAELEMAGSKITVDAPSSDRKGRDGGGHLERLKALGYVADDEDGSNGND